MLHILKLKLQDHFDPQFHLWKCRNDGTGNKCHVHGCLLQKFFVVVKINQQTKRNSENNLNVHHFVKDPGMLF